MRNNGSDQISRTKSQRDNVVIVLKPVARTKSGGVHIGSRRAIIAQARRMRPEHVNSAVVEMHYGTSESVDTVVVFDGSKDKIWGM